MNAWRQHKRNMRRGVHEHMGVPALYLHTPEATPWPLTIRGPHNKRPLPTGDLPGSEGWAEREDTQPRLVFWREELPAAPDAPMRMGGIISVEAGEAYRLGIAHPVDDVVQVWEVTPLDAEEATGLPLPDPV